MNENPASPIQRGVFFSKQPILDRKRSIWGYELLGGEMNEGIYEVFPQQKSAVGLCSSAYVGLQEAMERGKKIVVAFDDTSILSGVPYALPPSHGIVRVLPAVARVSGFEEALERLRTEGYLTAVEVMPDRPLPAAICRQTDIFVFDFGTGCPDQAVLEQIRAGQGMMMARGVRTMEQFQTSRDMEFSLFHGPFFKESERVRDRKLGSNAVSRLNIFRLMEDEDPDVKALAAAIRADVSISFRLLSYLNSAWFGLRHNIQSIDQAIMLLGWLKLKNWLRAVLLVDLAGQDEIPQELAALSLQRGKFLELLATEYDYWGFNPNTLFLVGLFSLMDAILGLPMEHVVELLPLDAKLKAALRRDPNNEYRPLFELLESVEEADLHALQTQTQDLFLDFDRIKNLFADARDWAGAFFISSAR